MTPVERLDQIRNEHGKEIANVVDAMVVGAILVEHAEGHCEDLRELVASYVALQSRRLSDAYHITTLEQEQLLFDLSFEVTKLVADTRKAARRAAVMMVTTAEATLTPDQLKELN